MSKIAIGADTRVTYDSKTGAPRSWFDTTVAPAAKTPFSPQDVGRDVLSESADMFRWEADLPDLRERAVIDGQEAYSIRFSQEFKGVPVDSSEVIVNMYADSRVYSIYNHYHYDIPRTLDPKKTKVRKAKARELVQSLLAGFKGPEIQGPELIVYQYEPADNHPPKPPYTTPARDAFLAAVQERLASNDAGTRRPKPGDYFLAWDLTVTTKNPSEAWRFLIDAMTGRLINVIDLFQYATGTGQVFDPNPIVTSDDTTLNSGSPIGTLDAERVTVTLDRLDPPVAGNLHLDGSYVRVAEIESPVFPEPVNAAGNFGFSSNDRNFLATMAYFHIDRLQNYIQTVLGLTNVANFSIPVDPQGQSGADNSRYSPAAHDLSFGEGGVPDAADAHVILHEYGHAIQDNWPVRNAGGLPAFSNYASGISEGFGDFLAAVYYDDKLTGTRASRGHVMSYDGNLTDSFSWNGRRYDVTWLFDGSEFAAADGHSRGQLWCATMFELYRKLGGDSANAGVQRRARDLTLRLHLMGNLNVARSGATATHMGQEIEASDSTLGGWRYANGLHKKVIYDTFRRRHLPVYPDKAVDVYVNDGREGGYGSASGNDLFTEKLWDENFWNTQDIWVRTTPYANAADQAAGQPSDHVEPPVGSTAYLYTRVKNKGTNAAGSGSLTVKAFHCIPGMGLTWPDSWTPMDTPSLNVANVLPGPANGVVVGPFPWTPGTVGHECVLVIVESANDRALTQDLLPTDLVPHSDLVPFDNNIAQRNLVPTSPKGKMIKGFYVNNPFPEVGTVKLHFNSSLPEGWQWRSNLVRNEIRLGPLERRWVELAIDQAGGKEVTQFDKPQKLEVIGTIDDTVIGGMTFYIAPPSTFGPAPKPGGGTLSIGDSHSVAIPWSQSEIKGEITIKIRFGTP